MTDYAIRINISNEQLFNITEYIKSIPNVKYLIGPIEIGTKTNKEHVHIYLKTDMKKDTLVKTMKRKNLIQSGNRSYSCVQITQKKPYKTLQEAIEYYKTYCIKTLDNKENINTNLELQEILQLPKWEDKKTFIKNKKTTIKDQLKQGYEIISYTNIPLGQRNRAVRLHIINYIINYYKDQDKPFTTSMVKMYCNYILVQFYPKLININELYCEWFKYNETIIF